MTTNNSSLEVVPQEIEMMVPEGALSNLEILEDKKVSDELPMADVQMSLPAALCDDLLLREIAAIPDQMGFKIGDVAELLQVKQYVLRYWESEFDILKPKKANNKQRLYTKRDVENAFLIRKLLHRDRFSIEGARHALKELKAHVKKEKDFAKVIHRFESFHERIEKLALDIRQVRQLFSR